MVENEVLGDPAAALDEEEEGGSRSRASSNELGSAGRGGEPGEEVEPREENGEEAVVPPGRWEGAEESASSSEGGRASWREMKREVMAHSELEMMLLVVVVVVVVRRQRERKARESAKGLRGREGRAVPRTELVVGEVGWRDVSL